MKLTLGRFVFRTRGDAAKAVQKVLHNSLPGMFLSGDDLDLVTAVLDRHPDREWKLTGGMMGIMVVYARTEPERRRWRPADREMVIATLDRTEERIARIMRSDSDPLAGLVREDSDE